MKNTVAMSEKVINISYREYDSKENAPLEYRELLKNAMDAADCAYAPYSNFHVGAAIKMSNGIIVTGSNQENAAYPSGLCAERVALFHAHHSYPHESVEAIAVIAKNDTGELAQELTVPCAACIQVMVESEKRGKRPITIIIGSATKIITVESVQNLLTFSFGK